MSSPSHISLRTVVLCYTHIAIQRFIPDTFQREGHKKCGRKAPQNGTLRKCSLSSIPNETSHSISIIFLTTIDIIILLYLVTTNNIQLIICPHKEHSEIACLRLIQSLNFRLEFGQISCSNLCR